MTVEVTKEELLSDDNLAVVNAGLKFYRECDEESLARVLTFLEDGEKNKTDKPINFLTYINPTDDFARMEYKRVHRAELIGRKCGYCEDPVLECNC